MADVKLKMHDRVELEGGYNYVVGQIEPHSRGVRVRLDTKFRNSINLYIYNQDEEPEQTIVYKQVTEENYELIAWYMDVNPASARMFVGKWVEWVDSPTNVPPQWMHWINRVPEKYLTVTDGYLADRLVNREKK